MMMAMQGNEHFNWDQYNKNMDGFVSSRLRNDGVLMVRFIAAHCGHLAAISLVVTMFDDYIKGIVQQPKVHSSYSCNLDYKFGRMM